MKTQAERVIALGFFDGVHLGHGSLLETAKKRAAEKELRPAVMSFDCHPSALVDGETVPLINSVQDRKEILHRVYGIDDVILLHFDRRMMTVPWDQFVSEVLVGEMGARHLVCGYDFRFGDKGRGDPQRLREKCADLGVGCDVLPRFTLGDVTVSSTHIRKLLEEGKPRTAMDFLGHPHCLSGEVVHGRQLGRTIGTPTANLLVPEGVLAPAFGVYATKVTLPGNVQKLAVTNVGVRPTVGNSGTVTVEPWILDYDGDLYGKHLRVDFYDWLRGEKKFDSLAALQKEILKNAEETRALLAQ